MKLFNWILMMVLVILLAACLITFPFIYTIDNIFLSEGFYTETLNEQGVYDSAYDLFAERLDETVSISAEEKGLPPEAADWMSENVFIVFDREYVTGLMEDQAVGMIAYLTGKSDDMPQFDLEPKYDELKQVTQDRLDADTVMMLLDAQPDSLVAVLLNITGIVNDAGEVNPTVKQYAVEVMFDSNPQIETMFQMENPLKVMTFVGMENPEASIQQTRTLATTIHRGAMLVLLAISCLTALILLVGIRKIRIPILVNAWTYTVTALFVIIAGASAAIGTRVYEKLILKIEIMDSPLAQNLKMDTFVNLFGKGVLSIGLIFIGAGIVFFILEALFCRKRRRENRI